MHYSAPAPVAKKGTLKRACSARGGCSAPLQPGTFSTRGRVISAGHRAVLVRTVCTRRYSRNATAALSPAVHLHFLPEERNKGCSMRIPEDACPNYSRHT